MAGKISAQTARDPVDGTEYLATEAGGSNYKTLISKIKDYILTFFTNKTTLDKIEYYEGTFENADLTDGVATFTLTQNRSAVFVSVENPSGYIYTGYSINRPAQNQFALNFGGAGSTIAIGTWKVKTIALT